MGNVRDNPHLSVVVNFRHEPATPTQAAALKRLYDRLLTRIESEEPAPHLESEPASTTLDLEAE